MEYDPIALRNLTDHYHQVLDTLTGSGWRFQEDMRNTPVRVAKMWLEMTQPGDFEFTTFPNKEGYDQLIIQTNIPFQSICAHHLLPFIGRAHVGYIPRADGRYVGLSKLARTVDYFGRCLGTQEDITQRIGMFLEEQLEPLGVGVIIEAEHMCMRLRGVERDGVVTKTSFMRGVLLDKPEARAEFLRMVYG